jgi:hypothetical protein
MVAALRGTAGCRCIGRRVVESCSRGGDDAVRLPVVGTAVAEELVPSTIYKALRAVGGLRMRRTSAPERPGRRPVPWECVEPVLAHYIERNMKVVFERMAEEGCASPWEAGPLVVTWGEVNCARGMQVMILQSDEAVMCPTTVALVRSNSMRFPGCELLRELPRRATVSMRQAEGAECWLFTRCAAAPVTCREAVPAIPEPRQHFLPRWASAVAELATLAGVLGSELFAQVHRRGKRVALAAGRGRPGGGSARPTSPIVSVQNGWPPRSASLHGSWLRSACAFSSRRKYRSSRTGLPGTSMRANLTRKRVPTAGDDSREGLPVAPRTQNPIMPDHSARGSWQRNSEIREAVVDHRGVEVLSYASRFPGR